MKLIKCFTFEALNKESDDYKSDIIGKLVKQIGMCVFDLNIDLLCAFVCQ